MKRFIILLLILVSVQAGATHWFTYYIYLETTYIQGPWVRTDLLSKSDYKYLAPKVYEDLFGTMKEELAGKLLERLREEKPAVYDWGVTLSLHGDTVWLEIEGSIDQPETVANEVTATMILNSFSAVCFKYQDRTAIFSLSDITLPLFDLVSVSDKEPAGTGNEMVPDQPVSEPGNPLLIWLILSAVLNLVLITWIFIRLRK